MAWDLPEVVLHERRPYAAQIARPGAYRRAEVNAVRIDKEKFWAVRDPTPASEIGDVLMEFTLPEFVKYVIGTHMSGQTRELDRMAFYDKKTEAARDAVQRMGGQELINRAFMGDILKG